MKLADKIYRPLYFINNLYFVRCINFLLHYLMQKVLVCQSLIASFLTKALPRTSRGSGLLGPHSLLSEPAHFQVELWYNYVSIDYFLLTQDYLSWTPLENFGKKTKTIISIDLCFLSRNRYYPVWKCYSASATRYFFGSLFSPADKLWNYSDLYLYLSTGSL